MRRIITIIIDNHTLTVEIEERTHPLRKVEGKYMIMKVEDDVFLQGFVLDLNLQEIINKIVDHLIRKIT